MPSMHEAIKISLETADVKWAMQAASTSIGKWSGQAGYYNNRFDSHFNGKAGELAAEKYLLENGYTLDSHFRFSDREKLSHLV
mgnify:FL=1